MIDLHCHILPGVDDGARTLEDSLEMARMAVANGTTKVVATPHMMHPQFHVPGPVAKERHAELVAALRQAQIPLEVALAGEIHWSVEIPERLARGELLPLSAERGYILFELPATHVPHAFREVCWQLHLAGIYPVLAHPERNLEFERDPDSILPLREAGIPVQITAMSLTGAFGRRARKVSRRWLEAGMVDLVASDGHSTRARPPLLADAARAVRKIGGSTLEDWVLTEVPRRILGGEPVV